MVDYSKWDALELSDDSDIEVHPNVDKRSFIKAKQNQIHTERQQRKLQIEALRYEGVNNNTLIQRLSALLSALKLHGEEASLRNPVETALQAVMELAPLNPEEDNPPPRPEGVFDADQPLPSYSKMVARILDEVNKQLDEKRIEKDKRYEALTMEVGIHLQNIQDSQEEVVKKLDELEKENETKITSDSYRIGFDSSHVIKAKPGDKSKEKTKLELLNPHYDVDDASCDTSTTVMVDYPKDDDEDTHASPVAKKFAQIEASDYRASQGFISSHPEILQESETDGLLMEAINAALKESDYAQTYQYVHQAVLLQCCRMLGRDGVALFFKRMATRGHQGREIFEKEVVEKFQQIKEIAARHAKQRATEGDEAAEQIQIQSVERDASIHIRIPQAESEDEEERKARAVFEGFAPEMRVALESGSLDEVNKVLGTMRVPEAENLVILLGDLVPSLDNTVLQRLPSPNRLHFARLRGEIVRRAMADQDNHYGFPDDGGADEDQSIISTRGLEAFGRKVTTTATHLMAPNAEATALHYHTAMAEVHKQLQHPTVQRSVFSMARTTPTDLVRARLSTTEIRHRALTHLDDELLANIPEHDNSYSLFQGFQASFPELTDQGKKHRRRVSRGRKLLDESPATPGGAKSLAQLKREKAAMMHEFELLGVRKNMASSEIREIDNKIANLHGMRRVIMTRLAGLEQEEALLEHDIIDVEGRLDEAQTLVDEAEIIAQNTPSKDDVDLVGDADDHDPGFMSQSVYEKLPGSGNSTPSRKPKRVHRRVSMPILHEHYEAGSSIREIRAHRDNVTALDFDAPFGTMVTAALDDTVKVWDLNAGRCMGFLEGHAASVRALQVEDNILATGSADATIRLWDLSRCRYDPKGNQFEKDGEDEDAIAFENPDDQPIDPPEGSMEDCALFTLEAHVDEITALHFRGDVLVSGSADKTLRHWDLEKGRCVQTLDVMWAAAQASASSGASDGPWRPTGRSQAGAADFVGAVQVFESALACGTADGMVRLWDLRSGQVHRSLVGHTGAVTCLQFDDVHLVTGSLDRSVRIWDLRTGSIYDAYAYDNPITSMMFDTRRIVSAAGEDVAKVYDKVEGRQWDCGAGIAAAEEGKSPAVVERVYGRVKNMKDESDSSASHELGASSFTPSRMEPIRDQLLSRYLQAAETMADASASSLGTRAGPSTEGHAPGEGPQNPGMDAQGAAVEALLRRQALLVARMHKATVTGAARTPYGVDEELLRRRLGDTASIAMGKFYSYRYDRVPAHWRCLYTDALVLTAHYDTVAALAAHGRLADAALDRIVGSLDRALITTGGAGRLGAAWIEATLRALEALCAAQEDAPARPLKRRRRGPAAAFPAHEPGGRPPVAPDRECPRYERWTLGRFEDYMNGGAGGPRPAVFTDLLAGWPALTDRPWSRPDYLLSRTFGGRRLVPVEVGRSYVDEGWGQELIPFKAFLARYVAPGLDDSANDDTTAGDDDTAGARQVGYLAQHDLFRQVPALRNDLTIPDFCWASVPRHPCDASQDQPPVDAPQLNAWFGPARTITPLHTDGYHNLLCQVVGTKYVRLYPPRATPRMRARAPEHGVDMSNTSGLDVGVLEGWDAPPPGVDAGVLEDMRAALEGVKYWECVLRPGDALVIPIGWWHYVRSLSVSFSVSFWWN
ncbi:Mitochondrial division protein 1 [Tolypocladium ophioglossoides CBS 100239]|uniref:Mitochondrial division protein 1 n=1 Tax=Tolypocladium ophioglossoides (strain CBS 100239) TaxID=1163406 RepID=A0A0L0N167_TOLOC|nr:Mitochondrial division protein 1 [Tolypocladium ophioglossoides CBS 100239]